MGRLTKNEEEKLKKAIASIMANRKSEIIGREGKPSPSKIEELLKKEFDLDLSRQTIAKYVDEGFVKYKDYVNVSDNEKVKEIRDAMVVQKSIWNNEKYRPIDRSKASMAWKSLHKQLLDYEKYLQEAELKIREVEKSIYHVSLIPKTVKVKCPKCGGIYIVTDEVRYEGDEDE